MKSICKRLGKVILWGLGNSAIGALTGATGAGILREAGYTERDPTEAALVAAVGHGLISTTGALIDQVLCCERNGIFEDFGPAPVVFSAALPFAAVPAASVGYLLLVHQYGQSFITETYEQLFVDLLSGWAWDAGGVLLPYLTIITAIEMYHCLFDRPAPEEQALVESQQHPVAEHDIEAQNQQRSQPSLPVHMVLDEHDHHPSAPILDSADTSRSCYQPLSGGHVGFFARPSDAAINTGARDNLLVRKM